MSPHSVEGTNQYYQNEFNAQPYRLLKDIDISFCGAPKEGEEFSPKLFELQKVPFDDFTMLFKIGNNPFENQNLVVRIGDQYYDWKAACPIIMSMALYERSFPNDITKEILNNLKNYKQEKQCNDGILADLGDYIEEPYSIIESYFKGQHLYRLVRFETLQKEIALSEQKNISTLVITY